MKTIRKRSGYELYSEEADNAGYDFDDGCDVSRYMTQYSIRLTEKSCGGKHLITVIRDISRCRREALRIFNSVSRAKIPSQVIFDVISEMLG